MTTALLAALVFFCAGLCAEGYFLLASQQRMRTTNEQLLASSIDNRRLLEANMRLLGLQPSKSAAPTTAPDDAPPFAPYQGLRDAELARWTDDGGAPEPQPDPAPATRPAAVVLVEQWAADVEVTGPIPAVQEPVLIPGEEWRARFNFREAQA